jgi:predicted permease
VPNEARIEINHWVLFFCLVTSTLTGILFGLAPAWHISRPDIAEALKDEGRSSSTSSSGKMRALLVVGEVALSVVLLVGAGLTIRSFLAIQQVRLGFRPDHVLTVDLPLNAKRYATWEQRNRFCQELLARVQNLPGVRAVTMGEGGLPFRGPQSTYAIEGWPSGEDRRVMVQLVSDGYLKAMGIPLLRGRMLTEQEVRLADPVAVINEAAAALWPAGQEPVGRRLRLDLLLHPGSSAVLTPSNAVPDVTVVGVIGNARNDELLRGPQPAVLVPYTLLATPGRTLAVRTEANPASFMNGLRGQIREMDPEQPLHGLTTFEEILSLETAQPRFVMSLFSLFAALGLALAMAGIYSVLSYLVSMRTREIGVRMALGARQSDVLRLVLGLGGRLVGIGIVVGALASFGTTRLLSSQVDLFQVGPGDPMSFFGVVLLLSIVALAACLVPARRAARIDPMEALREF